MKKISLLALVFLSMAYTGTQAQEVETLFHSSKPSGGYAALGNKFTSIRGEYANIAEIYGGWFIHRRFLLGIGAAASTNKLQVPFAFSTAPLRNMSWQYGQLGLMTEYVFWSNRVVHLNITLFSGGGFTLQYERKDMDEWDNYDYDNDDLEHDENFFYVMEPGAQLELNLLKWMRLSPGISYRKTFGSEGIGLRDDDLSDWSYNISLKFGKF
jgi:hypothetical protein